MKCLNNPIAMLLVFILVGCTGQFEKNRLSDENSEYLKLSQNSKVWWQPWNKDVLERARDEQRLIFLTVGNLTCESCVKANRDLFTPKRTIRLLNRKYVSIMMDRHEFPSIARLMMDFQKQLSGKNIWPIYLVLTPEGVPFFSGASLRTKGLADRLSTINRQWQVSRSAVKERSVGILNRVFAKKNTNTPELPRDLGSKFYNQVSKHFDYYFGGIDSLPKFYHAESYRYLLRVNSRSSQVDLEKEILRALDGMIHGSVFDPIHGGFFSYSMRSNWGPPSFEKKLETQLELGFLFLESYQVFQDEQYKTIVDQILSYILRELRGEKEGFFAGQGGNCRGVFGDCYGQDYYEVKKILSAGELKAIEGYFGLKGTNKRGVFQPFALHKQYRHSSIPQIVSEALEKIRLQSLTYPQPKRDKIVVAGMSSRVIALLAKTGTVFGNSKYIDIAKDEMKIFLKLFSHGGDLYHMSLGGQAKLEGELVDFAYSVDALLELFQITGENYWLEWAEKIHKTQDKLFYNSKKGAYSELREGSLPFARQQYSWRDYPGPSAQSVSLLNVLRLRDITFRSKYKDRVKEMVSSIPVEVVLDPLGFPGAQIALDYYTDLSKEVAVILPKGFDSTRSACQGLFKPFSPNKVVVCSNERHDGVKLVKGKRALGGKVTYYVCESGLCKLPTDKLSEALVSIKKNRRY